MLEGGADPWWQGSLNHFTPRCGVILRHPLSNLKNFRSDQRIGVENFGNLFDVAFGQVWVVFESVAQTNDVSGRKTPPQRNHDPSTQAGNFSETFRKAIDERSGYVQRYRNVDITVCWRHFSLQGCCASGRCPRIYWHGQKLARKL